MLLETFLPPRTARRCVSNVDLGTPKCLPEKREDLHVLRGKRCSQVFYVADSFYNSTLMLRSVRAHLNRAPQHVGNSEPTSQVRGIVDLGAFRWWEAVQIPRFILTRRQRSSLPCQDLTRVSFTLRSRAEWRDSLPHSCSLTTPD